MNMLIMKQSRLCISLSLDHILNTETRPIVSDIQEMYRAVGEGPTSRNKIIPCIEGSLSYILRNLLFYSCSICTLDIV